MQQIDRKISEEFNGEKIEAIGLETRIAQMVAKFFARSIQNNRKFLWETSNSLFAPTNNSFGLVLSEMYKSFCQWGTRSSHGCCFSLDQRPQTPLTQSLFPIDILPIHNWILKLYVNKSFLLWRKRMVHALETSMERTNNLNIFLSSV